MPPSDFIPGRDRLGRLSAVVLAGGAARRFGSDKTRARLGGRRLVDRAALGLKSLVDDVVVVTRRPRGLARLARAGVRVVADRCADFHPLGGLLAGLEACRHPAAFVCAADMPFVEPRLVALLAGAAAGREAAVPRWDGRVQPLCAVYSRRLRGVLKAMLAEGRLALCELFELVPTRFVLEDEVRAVDPAGRSFLDIDTRADLRRISREARRGA